MKDYLKIIPTNREVAEEFNRLESEFQAKAKDNIMICVCEICGSLFKMKYFMESSCSECVKKMQVF